MRAHHHPSARVRSAIRTPSAHAGPGIPCPSYVSTAHAPPAPTPGPPTLAYVSRTWSCRSLGAPRSTTELSVAAMVCVCRAGCDTNRCSYVRACVWACAYGRRAPVRVTVRAGEGYSCRKRGEVCAGCFCHGCRNGGTVVAAASGTPTSPPPGSGSVTAQQYQQIGGMHEVVHTYDEEGRLRYARGDPCPRSLSPS
jgi:hypothetical protein